jgi:Skp family chaperone for outer membrane proteins
MAVSAYGSKGKLSDEVIVNLQNLRTQIEPDKTAARSFWERTDILLNIAQQALDAKQLPTAQTNLDNAKIIWNKWLQQHSNWLLQFDYYDNLCQRLKAKDLQQTSTLYLQAIDRDLKQTLLGAPELSTPNDLQKNLTILSEQLNRYISLNTQLEKLKLSINTLEGDRLEEWEDKAAEFTSQLQTLIPSQSVEIQALQTAINTGIETVKGLGMPVFTESKSLDIEPGLVLQAPSVQSTLPTDNFALRSWTTVASLWLTPKGRLRLFQLSTYLISFTVLAGGGFERLYASKPTFGANGWSDYFSLLVLGFGAEATRNVVTQVAGKKEP